jgi:tripartite-type tricarboxylate transporter receptor subunit TctC
MNLAFRFGFALLLAACAASAHAAYPERLIRIVMPFPAGGASDAVARIIAPELAARLGQPVQVENHPGAQGVLAGQTVANAPADGYTLLYAVSATAALPVVTKTSYDMSRDFTPVSTIGAFEFGMFVSSTVPVTSVQEFIAYARKNPGKVNYATLNLGEEFAAATFAQAAGIDMMKVPFTSGAQILTAMANNEVHVNFGPLVNGLTLTKGGRARVLATLGAERSARAPDVPTMKESGLSAVEFDSAQLLFARANTPAKIVEKLSHEINAVLSRPEIRARLEKLALRVKGSTPDEMQKAQAAANAMWARLAREYHLGAE